jgi:hypothetical protein
MPLFFTKHEGKSISILKLHKNVNYGYTFHRGINGQRIKHALCIRASRSRNPIRKFHYFRPNFFFLRQKITLHNLILQHLVTAVHLSTRVLAYRYSARLTIQRVVVRISVLESYFLCFFIVDSKLLPNAILFLFSFND